MSKFIDLTGMKFGKLTVVERLPNKNGVTIWKCKCDCGNYNIVRSGNLKSGAVKSCGCLNKESIKRTHNMSNTRLYHIWGKMRARCYNKKINEYKNYGGRGISIYKEWDSFENFYNWAIQHGYSDELTIERIDVNGNYEPSNCKWIPLSEQAQNRRSCKFYTFNGETKNLAQWCLYFNIPYKLVHNRIFKLGWDFEKAISTPCDINKRNRKNYG